MSALRVGLAGWFIVWALTGSAGADDWPQWMGPARDGRWNETGIIRKFPEGGPRVLWRTPVAWGYAGPAVAAGRVYVTDYQTEASINELNNPGSQPPVAGRERILCLDAGTGQELWKHEYDCPYRISYPAGPRCTPTVAGGKVYALGAMGHLVCLDAERGTVLWSRNFQEDFDAKPPYWGHSAHPLVDGQRLICVVGGRDGVVYGFDKDTGKELWHNLEAKNPGYCPPSVIEAGGRRQVLIWHGEELVSLDPENGKRFWSVPLVPQFGMSIAAPRREGDLLFASGYGQSVLLRLAADKPEVTEVYRGKSKTTLYSINATPFLDEGILYGPDQPGPFRAVKLSTGDRLWETNQPITGMAGGAAAGSGTAFVVKNGDLFFLASETGHLIIARLSAREYEEIGRWKMLDPTGSAFGRTVLWSHPAFAQKCVFARNDKEIICASLAE